MIPMGRLSTTAMSAAFKSPDSVDPPSGLVDYELGGIGLNDPSQGLQVQVWTARIDPATDDVLVGAGASPEVAVFNAPNVTELSLAFDQNMRPVIAYVQAGQAKLRWYDTVPGTNVITTLASDVQWPKVTLDDKRDTQTTVGANDVILAYVRNNNLYYRQQRDRFETEYLLKTDVNGRLLRVGMNELNRLQFMFEEILP